jgi:hypothetical protein
MNWAVKLALVFGFACCSWGQVMEDWIEAADNPEELQVWIQELRENPLDLNQATVEELSRLPFMDNEAAKRMLKRRGESEGFDTFEDAIQLAGLTDAQVESMREFTYVPQIPVMPARSVIRSGGSISGDAGKRLETSNAGYRLRADIEGNEGQTGFLFGYRGADRTEFFQDASFGISVPSKGYRPRLLAGDFQMESGTGLVFATSYGMGSWMSSSDAFRVPESKGLVSRPSSNRLAVQRGVATEIEYRFLKVQMIAALNRLDAAIENGEAMSITEGASSSTELEQARDNQLEERLLGASVKADGGWCRTGMTGYASEFTPGFRPTDIRETMPRLGERRLQVGSVYGRASRGSLEAISEFASASSGGIAHQSALTWQENNASWSIYHLYADAGFYSPHSKFWSGFGEDAGNAKSTGLRASWRGQGYRLALSGSTERTPFRTSTSPLRKSGDNIEAQVRVFPVDAFELNLLTGRRWNEITSQTEPSIGKSTDRGRLELIYHGQEEYKVRVELKSSARETGHNHALGTLAFFQIKSAVRGVKLIARVSVWNVENSDASLGMHETSIYGAYPLVLLDGTGRRSSLMLVKQWNGFQLGCKIAHTIAERVNDETETVEFAMELGYRR